MHETKTSKARSSSRNLEELPITWEVLRINELWEALQTNQPTIVGQSMNFLTDSLESHFLLTLSKGGAFRLSLQPSSFLREGFEKELAPSFRERLEDACKQYLGVETSIQNASISIKESNKPEADLLPVARFPRPASTFFEYRPGHIKVTTPAELKEQIDAGIKMLAIYVKVFCEVHNIEAAKEHVTIEAHPKSRDDSDSFLTLLTRRPRGETNTSSEPRRDRPEAAFDTIVGHREIIDELVTHRLLIASSGQRKRWAAEPWRAILLTGEAGVGKTMLAAAFIKDTPAIYVRAGELDRGMFTIPAEVLRNLYQAAQQSAQKEGWDHGILVIDNLENLFAGDSYRDLPKRVHDFAAELTSTIGEARVPVTTLLITKSEKCLPQSLFDVLDVRFPVDLPTPKDIQVMLEHRLQAASSEAGRVLYKSDIDFEALAEGLRGSSGRDISLLVDRVLRKKCTQELPMGKVDVISADDILSEHRGRVQ